MSAGMPLLLPIDTDAPSELAVRLAALCGQRLSDEVVLLHVSEAPPPLERLAELHALAAPIREREVPVRLRTVRGIPSQRIPEVAHERGADWILMGTSGEDFRPGGGSTARAVMRTSRVPVIAVRPGVLPADPDARIALVGAQPGHAAGAIARVLAAARGLTIREHGPDLAPLDGLPAGEPVSMTVAPFDPDCAVGTWCRELLARDPRPVVLVSGGACACLQPGRTDRRDDAHTGL